MEEKFKINLKSHFKSGWLILFSILVLIIFIYFMAVKTGNDLWIFITISIGIFILFCVPAIIIHLNYYIVNKGYTFCYRHNEREITIGHNGKHNTFNIDDIKHIDRFMSHNFATNRSGLFRGTNIITQSSI
jgi:hypothetical protein